MIGSICTGYLVKPRILEQDIAENSKLQITEETLEFLTWKDKMEKKK